jgi:hypothetical protein
LGALFFVAVVGDAAGELEPPLLPLGAAVVAGAVVAGELEPPVAAVLLGVVVVPAAVEGAAVEDATLLPPPPLAVRKAAQGLELAAPVMDAWKAGEGGC